jgi:polar amino acid transport system substrate-binding protein
MKEAYSRLGIDIEYRDLPTERALVMANAGNTDGTFLRITGLEQKYPNLVLVSYPLQYTEVVVFTKEAEFAVEGWHSLAPYTIGIVRGFKVAEANTKGMKVDLVATVKQAFLKLDAGRNDIVVDLKIAQCKLKGLDVSGIRVLKPPIALLPLYHYLHRRHRALAVKVEAVLTRMEQEGELKIMQKQATQDFQQLCGQ